MDAMHFRNAPVVNDDGKIVGNLTHFALIRYLADSFPEEVLNLPPTPDQFGEERFGG
jgi:CBS domain-containing protein